MLFIYLKIVGKSNKNETFENHLPNIMKCKQTNFIYLNLGFTNAVYIIHTIQRVFLKIPFLKTQQSTLLFI